MIKKFNASPKTNPRTANAMFEEILINFQSSYTVIRRLLVEFSQAISIKMIRPKFYSRSRMELTDWRTSKSYSLKALRVLRVENSSMRTLRVSYVYFPLGLVAYMLDGLVKQVGFVSG